ncbi:signal peptidase I [Sediminicola luteus]|uniref:Signal peptidase I n=1 Tax=Sediminicola luteus TaxID=319238 RepID=A0A2A4G8T9_9FLAO|nr:signal peptidase I [Sediminicola luteus]PCE64831.1 signal peptidase I [Sediminicola luteus]
MNGTQWIIFILVIQLIHFAATWKLYVKAGRKAWEAAIPVYNAIVLMKIINRPAWWTILLFIPIINLLMFPVVWVETIRSFGRNSTLDTWAVILTLGFYIFYVSYVLDVEYMTDRSTTPKTATGEWVSSIVFAIVAATLVHTYFIQPYVIPTGSLEKTLLIGDFLFVSKFHYGARAPMTTVAAPMVHDTLPVLKTRSYVADVNPDTHKTSIWNKLQLPYMRLPGFQKVKKNDIVVFSWPADTVRRFFVKERGVKKPIDKKSNYVKRCVGTPGDSLSIVDGDVYIDGEKLILSDRAKPQFTHLVTTKGQITQNALNLLGKTNYAGNVIRIPDSLLQQEKVRLLLDKGASLEEVSRDKDFVYFTGAITHPKVAEHVKAETVNDMLLFNMTDQESKSFVGREGISNISRFSFSKASDQIFPQSSLHQGTIDNMKSFYIPQAGASIPLTIENLPYYKKIITEYEGHELAVAGNQISIDGQVTNNYTFGQNYYWMMGDNRHRSEDSRYWGFVPEDHIVGRPVFIWFSLQGIAADPNPFKVRWDRVFTTVGGDGEPRSYFKYFLILLAGWFVFDYFRKRKKKNA